MTSTTFADGHPVQTAREDASEEILLRCCMECGVSQGVALDVLSFYEENIQTDRAERLVGEYEKHIWRWLQDSIAELKAYLDRQQDDPRLLRMAVDCWILAMRMPHIALAETPTEIARNVGLGRLLGTNGKATAHKCFTHFQRTRKLPPSLNQRNEQARSNMSEARKKQVSK